MKLPKVVHIVLFSLAKEQVSDLVFGQKRSTQDTHDLKGASIDSKIMLDDSNEAICNDGNIDLNPDRILRVTPKGFDFQMLLDELEKIMRSFS